jgi:hypothetical protein
LKKPNGFIDMPVARNPSETVQTAPLGALAASAAERRE